MLIIINGRPGAGKDEFVKQCQNLLGDRVQNISTVDFVKEIAKLCGWNGVKDARNRKFLSDLKDLLTQYDDVPYKKIMHEYEVFKAQMEHYGFEEKQWITFVHCREPQEIQKFVDRNNALTLLIRRPAIESNDTSNHADQNVLDYEYNFVVMNDSTIEDLQDQAEGFLRGLGVWSQ